LRQVREKKRRVLSLPKMPGKNQGEAKGFDAEKEEAMNQDIALALTWRGSFDVFKPMIKITLILLQSDPRVADQDCKEVYVPSVPVKGDRFRFGGVGPTSDFTVHEVRFVEETEAEFSIQVDLLAD
jgi:hypothetical protein